MRTLDGSQKSLLVFKNFLRIQSLQGGSNSSSVSGGSRGSAASRSYTKSSIAVHPHDEPFEIFQMQAYQELNEQDGSSLLMEDGGVVTGAAAANQALMVESVESADSDDALEGRIRSKPNAGTDVDAML